MTVIELGLVRDGDDQPPTSGRPRPRIRRDLRSVLVAAVAVGCLLTATGSARPEPGGLPQLWSIPFHPDADLFAVTGDSVYTTNSTHSNSITAYDLRTGAVRWWSGEIGDASALGPFAGDVMLLPAGGTTVQLDAEDGSQVSQVLNRDTIAVDTATGRQLWRQAGEPTVISADRVLLAVWNSTGDTVQSLRVVQARDGRTVWSRPVPGMESWTVGSGPDPMPADRLVTVTDDGALEVVDLADGRVVAAGRVPWAGLQADASMTLERHRLYISDTSAVSAYDTETLRRLWRITLPGSGGFFGCGPLVCVNGGDSTAGYDRETGEMRWRIDGARNGYPLPDGLLLIADDDTGARHHLADSGTGRMLAGISAATPIWNSRTGDRLYLLARTRQPADLTSISSYDPRAGEPLLIGAIPAVVPWSCRNEGGLLVCLTLDQRLAVTDVG